MEPIAIIFLSRRDNLYWMWNNLTIIKYYTIWFNFRMKVKSITNLLFHCTFLLSYNYRYSNKYLPMSFNLYWMCTLSRLNYSVIVSKPSCSGHRIINHTFECATWQIDWDGNAQWWAASRDTKTPKIKRETMRLWHWLAIREIKDWEKRKMTQVTSNTRQQGVISSFVQLIFCLVS